MKLLHNQKIFKRNDNNNNNNEKKKKKKQQQQLQLQQLQRQRERIETNCYKKNNISQWMLYNSITKQYPKRNKWGGTF